MDKIKIGILGTSEIAFRRFLPALKKNNKFEYVGIASRDFSKTQKFIDEFGGNGFDGYDSLLNCSDIDAVYLPLPPALHYEWGKKALNAGKHVFMEKPFSIEYIKTKELLDLAEEKKLAVHENYMFQYHSQIDEIKEIIDEGIIGNIRIYRIAFGFPKRQENDFRYNKDLGGGSLLDCGGYTVKLASMLLGDTTEIKSSRLCYEKEYDVDLYGNAVLENKEGQTSQISFGMDNCYKCDLEVWGSTGNIMANRIFTAPVDFTPEAVLQKGNTKEIIKFKDDDTFLKSINFFADCIKEEKLRIYNYNEILNQSFLVSKFERRFFDGCN